MTEKQKEILALTMQLELKTKEFKILNKKFENLLAKNTNTNSSEYLELRKEYAQNYLDIKQINKRLNELND